MAQCQLRHILCRTFDTSLAIRRTDSRPRNCAGMLQSCNQLRSLARDKNMLPKGNDISLHILVISGYCLPRLRFLSRLLAH